MKHKKTCCILALLLLMFPLLAACGNNTATAMRLRKTEGTVNVSDSKDKKMEAREDLNLYDGYSVNTESESYAWVTLDSVKLTKMDQSSGIKIQKSGKKLKVNVESGCLFFNITEPLKDDESLDIRTSTLGIGVRGTCGWVESSEDGNTSWVYLLEGEVECTAVSEDGADNQSVSIAAGEKASLTEGGEIAVEKFDADAIPAFVRDEAEEDEALQNILDQGGWNASDSDGGGSSAEFSSWEQAGLEDHVMDWKDDALAAAMAEITGISDREIMLSDVRELTVLNLKGKGISNISALGELANLTALFLEQNNISDISVLGELTNVRQLTLYQNNISDINVLGGLTNLISLDLQGNKISDISVLGGLTNLTFLNLSGNKISDISVLGGLTNLTVLCLGGNSISDVSALGGLTNLTELYLGANNIADYSPVEFVPNLEK